MRPTALVKPTWASETTRRTPVRPRCFRLARNSRQKGSLSLSPTLRPSSSRRPSALTTIATTTAREQTYSKVAKKAAKAAGAGRASGKRQGRQAKASQPGEIGGAQAEQMGLGL